MKQGQRHGIEELKETIAEIAAGTAGSRRSVPQRWQAVWEALAETGAAYMSLPTASMPSAVNTTWKRMRPILFITISHRLGHFIHYEHDPILRDIVILKPDWLATAISYVLDDKETRKESN